jgi:hypothetical protein
MEMSMGILELPGRDTKVTFTLEIGEGNVSLEIMILKLNIEG